MVHSWQLDAMDADEMRKKMATDLSPLHEAVLAGKEDVALKLIQETDNLDTRHPENLNTPLHEAGRREMVSLVRALLEAGACADPANDAGESPLHYAAFAGNLEIVKLLVTMKASLNRQPHSAGLHTPLMRAVQQRKGMVAVFLLQSGADPYLRTKWGQNAFDLAEETRDGNVIQLLKEFRR